MKPVAGIRDALGGISQALVPFEPEHAARGEIEGARRLTRSREAPTDRLPEAGLDESASAQSGSPEVEELIEFAPQVEQDLIAALGGPTTVGELLRSRLLASGVDGLGWYVSFHQTGIQWGIYLPVSGLVLTALGVFGRFPCDLETKFRLALRLIHQHEMFHFAVDYAAAQLELLSGRPVWAPARTYLRSPKGYIVREEKVANAWMLRSLWRGRASTKLRGRTEAVRRFVGQQPEGYRDAPQVVGSDRFFPEVERLIRDYADASEAFDMTLLAEVDAVRLLPFEPYLDWRQCPIHVIHDEKRLNLPAFDLDLLRGATEIHETEGFKKQLSRFGREIQNAWSRTRIKLLTDVAWPGLDFKHFMDHGERAYSVRLSKACRAHLRKLPLGTLEAFRVGDHKSMGHG